MCTETVKCGMIWWTDNKCRSAGVTNVIKKLFVFFLPRSIHRIRDSDIQSNGCRLTVLHNIFHLGSIPSATSRGLITICLTVFTNSGSPFFFFFYSFFRVESVGVFWAAVTFMDVSLSLSLPSLWFAAGIHTLITWPMQTFKEKKISGSFFFASSWTTYSLQAWPAQTVIWYSGRSDEGHHGW